MELDSNCFRTFKAAALKLNFTETALELGMTQSGVSQHVARLERDLGTELFLRIGKKVVLTEAGQGLLHFVEAYQDQVGSLLDEIRDKTSTLKGRVSYAMPATCLLSPHFQLLLGERRKLFPGIELLVDLHFSEEVIQKVREAQLDFGFVTKKILDSELDYYAFCEEEYVLVSSNKTSTKELAMHSWISYPGSDLLAEIWINQHKSTKLKVQPASRTNSLHAALTMAANDVGIMAVPRHCVEASDQRKHLRIHDFGKRVKNMIYIVTLKTGKKPRRVEQVLTSFKAMQAEH